MNNPPNSDVLNQEDSGSNTLNIEEDIGSNEDVMNNNNTTTTTTTTTTTLDINDENNHNNSSNNNNRFTINNNNTKELRDGMSALDLLLKEGGQNRIITFCHDIDSTLNGGIALGKLTEFCGVPGVGKTQMAFQLAVNASIPKEFFGVAGKAVYIDSEGGYSCTRLREIATHLSTHLQEIATERSQKERDIAEQLSPDAILNNIFYYRVYHYLEQVALVHQLPSFLEINKDVRLIIVDSITYPFRKDFADMGLRTRLLLSIAQNLLSIAEKYNVAVVVMNQLTTKVTNTSNNQNQNQQTILVPALGDAWAHICTYRMILYWKEKQRYCHLYKSPSFKSCHVPFQVNSMGIRGIEQQDDDNNNDDE